MTTTTAPTKIVIVSGQEFSVPADTPIEDLRTHLAQTFPDVASATVQKGTKKIGDTTYETIEFVKKAGTKGATSAELAALLLDIPPIRMRAPASTATADLIERIRKGEASIAEALDAGAAAAIAALPYRDGSNQNGGTLCAQCDTISPVAAGEVSAW